MLEFFMSDKVKAGTVQEDTLKMKVFYRFLLLPSPIVEV
jgi:hypothetical protein